VEKTATPTVNTDTNDRCQNGNLINSEAECKDAAAALGWRFGGAHSLDYAAKGCFRYDGSLSQYHAVYWNTHPRGRSPGAADHHLVCFKVEVSTSATYSVNADTKDICQNGNRLINRGECQQAAESLGKRYGGAHSLDYAPKGCFEYDGAQSQYHGVYWNSHPRGRSPGAADHHAVCSKIKTDPGTPNTPGNCPSQFPKCHLGYCISANGPTVAKASGGFDPSSFKYLDGVTRYLDGVRRCSAESNCPSQFPKCHLGYCISANGPTAAKASVTFDPSSFKYLDGVTRYLDGVNRCSSD